MSKKELKRYKVIDRWIQGSITGVKLLTPWVKLPPGLSPQKTGA